MKTRISFFGRVLCGLMVPLAAAGMGGSQTAGRVGPLAAEQAAGKSVYVTEPGAGDKSGRDWANARAAATMGLQAALDEGGSGSSVFVGSGTYAGVSLRWGTGGEAGKTKALVGVDTGKGLPVLRSGFDSHNPAKTGGIFVTVAPGVSFVLIRNFVVENYKEGLRLRGRNKNVRVENVDVTNTRDAFWVDGGATAAEPESGSRDLVFRDCDVKNCTKRGFRFLNGSANVQVINCHVDAGGKAYSTEVFPICFHVIGGETGVVDKNFTFTNCSAANAWHDAGAKYWNGDGWAGEHNTSDLTWTNCASFNNTDGGWDLKTLRPKLTNCISIGNKRNYRLWARSAPAVLENCLSAFAQEHRSNAPSLGVWIKGSAQVTLTRCTLWGDGTSIAVEDGTVDKPTALNLGNCLVAPFEETGTALRFSPGVVFHDTGSVIRKSKSDAVVVVLHKPSPVWRGGDNSFDGEGAAMAGKGFRYQPSPPAAP